MDVTLQAKCDLLITNRSILRSAFKWDNALLSLAASALMTALDVTADAERLLRCKELLREQTSAFSPLRGLVKLPLLCKMATAEDPRAYLARVIRIFEQIPGHKWTSTDYKALAAMVLCDRGDPFELSTTIEKTALLYQKMKDQHPWLTTGEDLPLAAMLATSGLDTEQLLEEMEACYRQIKGTFSKNAAQSLSHVLALDPAATEAKCARTLSLFALLKARGLRLGTGYDAALLGVLAALPLSDEQIANEIAEAQEYLGAQKGFGALSLDARKRRMYAALMVVQAHASSPDSSEYSLLTATLAFVIAVQICMMIVIANAASSTC